MEAVGILRGCDPGNGQCVNEVIQNEAVFAIHS